MHSATASFVQPIELPIANLASNLPHQDDGPAFLHDQLLHRRVVLPHRREARWQWGQLRRRLQ